MGDGDRAGDKIVRRRRVILYNPLSPAAKEKGRVTAADKSKDFNNRLTTLESTMLDIQTDNVVLARREYSLKENIIIALESKIGSAIPVEQRNANLFEMAATNAYSRIFKSLEMLSKDITQTVGIPAEIMGGTGTKAMTFEEVIELKNKVKGQLKELGFDPETLEAQIIE
jgi:hypothetical protein